VVGTGAALSTTSLSAVFLSLSAARAAADVRRRRPPRSAAAHPSHVVLLM